MKFLFKPVDITALVFFRILFGTVLFIELIGEWAVGWLYEAFVEPQFFFKFYGFEWVPNLQSPWIYLLYIVLILLSICMITGFKYKITTTLFAIGYTWKFLMSEAFYLNHGYMICLVLWMMIFFPANRAFSIDAKLNPSIKTNTIPLYPIFLICFQMAVVYFFGGIAKLNPDWLGNLQPIKLWMGYKRDYFLIGDLLQKDYVHYILCWGGALFDLSIIFLLIFKRTRVFGFLLCLAFHLTNLMIFQIGAFPWVSLGVSVMYFPSDAIRNFFRRFIKRINAYEPQPLKPSPFKNVIAAAIAVYVLIQVLVPLRHWVIDNNPSWTEQGHRFAWHMMLRTKSSSLQFVVHTSPDDFEYFYYYDYLTKEQQKEMPSKPDMIWQMAQYIEQIYQEKGFEDVAVKVQSRAGLNGRPLQTFIDPDTDLTAVKYYPHRKLDWILPLKKDTE